MTTFGSYLAIKCGTDDGVDLVNSARTSSYIRAGLGPKHWSAKDCGDSSYLPDGHNGPFVSPAVDGAWWYDPARPESSLVVGLVPVKITGLVSNDITRDILVTDGGLAYNPIVRTGPKIIIEAAIASRTCCATAYFIRALRQLLQTECVSGSGSKVRALMAVPSSDPTITVTETTQWRTLANVGLEEDVEIVSSKGPSCGNCGCDVDVIIRFALRAAPGLWLDSVTLQAATIIANPADQFMQCFTDGDVVGFTDPYSAIRDPSVAALVRPPLPTSQSGNWCPPLFLHKRLFTIASPSVVSDTFFYELEPVVAAGSGDLRNLGIKVWEDDGVHPIGDDYWTSVNAVAGMGLSYLPANSTFRRTGCGNLSTITIGGVDYPAETNISGIDGATYQGPMMLRGSGTYFVEVSCDVNTVSATATVALNAAEVEP